MKPELSDILFREAEIHEQYFHAVSPPLVQTSNFCFETVADMQKALKDEYAHAVYSRGANPTLVMLRKKLAALEGAGDALVFSSGCAAIAAVLFHRLKKGDHMVCISKPYSWVSYFCNHILPRYGIEVSFAAEGSSDAYAAVTRPETRLYYLESPNTFTFEISDIGGIAKLAGERGIYTVIDNSYSTPLYQQPLRMGIDMVIHSGSKYLSGHSDVVAGVLAGRADDIRSVYNSEYLAFGAVLSPFDAWLMIRGLRTLELRLQRSSATAAILVSALKGHPAITRIYYPFLPSHPGYTLATRQMKACSGLFSMDLNVSSPRQVEVFCDALQYFLKAVSWGGFESLTFPALTFYDFDQPEKNTISWKTVRLYAGLEDADLLVDDLLNALNLLIHE